MARILREIDRGARTIDSTAITVTELLWDDGGRSFDAQLADGSLLTEAESFDTAPDDQQLLDLFDEYRGLWRCTGCHTPVPVADTDLVTDHLRDCTAVGGR